MTTLWSNHKKYDAYWPLYSTHWVLVVWIIVAHFHLCSLLGTLSRSTVLEVSAVRRPMRVFCGSRWGQCVLFINSLDSLMVPCLVYNTAMYTVYGRCGQYGWCMVNTLTGAWFIRTPRQKHCATSILYIICKISRYTSYKFLYSVCTCTYSRNPKRPPLNDLT